MKKRLALTIFLFSCVFHQAWAATIHVPFDYPTIQTAIDAALHGDQIIVYAGQHLGPIIIDKSLTIKSAYGVNKTSISSNIYINSDSVFITGFTVENIICYGSEENYNTNITIRDNYVNKIDLKFTSQSEIIGNNFYRVLPRTLSKLQNVYDEAGLLVESSDRLFIEENTIMNRGYGFYLYKSHSITLESNTFLSIEFLPIWLRSSIHNWVHENVFNDFGACLEYPPYNLWESNRFNGSTIGGCPSDSNNLARAIRIDETFFVEQSSTAYGRSGLEAIDGVTNGEFSLGSVTCTDSYPVPNYWQIKLFDEYILEKITLWNRTDCCSERLTNFYIEVSTDGSEWQEIIHEEGTVGESATYNLGSVPATNVRIRFDRIDFLSLAEVQIYGQEAW